MHGKIIFMAVGTYIMHSVYNNILFFIIKMIMIYS